MAAGNHTFTWSTTYSAFVNPNTINIYDSTNSTTLASSLANDGTEVVSFPSSITKTIRATHYWRIQGTNTKNLNFGRYFSGNWFWKRFIGESTNATVLEAEIESFSIENTPSRLVTGTFAFSTPGYKYFVFPYNSGKINPYNSVWYQDPPDYFRDASTNLNIAMADASDGYTDTHNGLYHQTLSITNSFGHSINYYIYRTKNYLNGNITITVE